MKKTGLLAILSEMIDEQEGINYQQPNFQEEWMEAQRYPEFREMGHDAWLKLGDRGYDTKYSSIEDVLGNVDLDYDGLDKSKKQRFESAFDKGVIEMPIVVKFSNNDYDLVAGNTRVAGLVEKGFDPTVWVVDLSKLNEYIQPADENEVDPQELEKGIKVEMEHTDDPDIAEIIALQHLSEDPHYYNKLQSLGLE